MRVLLLDIGNTRLKWALAQGSDIRFGAALVHAAPDFLAQLARSLGTLACIDAVWIADVRRSASGLGAALWVQNHFGTLPRYASTSATFEGIQNAYSDPQQLGVDRWLAMIGARKQGVAQLIVDAGSALTLDALAADGGHLGGMIFPGADMLRRALLRDTAQVQVLAELRYRPTPQTALGEDTRTCVEVAINSAAVALIDRATADLRQVLGAELELWITGGDGEPLRSALADPWRYDELLVLRGLHRVAQSSEST